MIIKLLQIKKVLHSSLFILLLSAVGKVNAQEYSYTYSPALGEYTTCNSSPTTHYDINVNSCTLKSSTVQYDRSVVNTTLYSHNTSTTRMRFRVMKCDESYFQYHNSGKVFIVCDNEVVFCDDYYISSTTTSRLTFDLYYDNFIGSKWFYVYLIGETANGFSYHYYAGGIQVVGCQNPTVITQSASDITTFSAVLHGVVSSHGVSPTAYYFEYGTSTSYGEQTAYQLVPSFFVNTDYYPDADISGLSAYQTYHYRIVAANNCNQEVVYGNDMTFTTIPQDSPPTSPCDPNPYNGQTGVSLYCTFSWNCTDPEGGSLTYDLYLGTTENQLTLKTSGSGTSAYLDDLDFNQTYYWKVVAFDQNNHSTEGPVWHFTTKAGESPWALTDGATVNGTSVTLNGRVNPRNFYTTYYFEYGTTQSYGNTYGQGYLSGTETLSVYTTISGLSPDTYHYRVVAYNSAGTDFGTDKTFTIENQDCFGDCSQNGCGDLGQEMYTAAQYLCDLGVVEGINDNLEPDNPITRAQLAKVALFGLYNGPSNVPNPLVTDYFPSIYPDLQNTTTYYYQAAKALLYLEYGDGRSPFDRDRSCFDPSGTISRCLVLKVLLETFNIAPLTSGTNVFDDYGPSGYGNSPFWGYAQKAYNLGIVQTTHFRPNDNCTRGEAFLYLYRILIGIVNNTIPAPNPVNTESPATSSFFIPANLSPEVVNAMRGVEYGNFNYYNKDFFNIPGYMNLSFGIAYNSYLTEMPDEFYPVKPMGKAWTHTYDMYMNVITDNFNNTSFYVFHLQNGLLLIYKDNLESLTQGNYYDLTRVSTNKYTLKSRDQLLYTFQRNSSSQTIFTLREIKDRNGNVITFSYQTGVDGQQRIQYATTLNRTLTFEYKDGTNLVSKVTDPMGRIVRFSYDSDNQLIWLKDAKNQTTYFYYGTLDIEKGLLTEIKLPKGNYVYNNYEQRKLKSMTRVANNNDHIHTTVSIENQYQSNNYQSIVTTTKGNDPSVSTTYQMNDKGRVTNISDGFHTDVSFEYGFNDNPDLVSKMTDEKTNIQTTYAYTSKGLPASMTITDGTTTIQQRTVYNSFNDIVEYYDANNNKTTYTYNSQGNMIKITDALGNQTNIVNNSHGVPTRVTNPMGVYADYGYNDYGNIGSISIPTLGLSSSISYDEVSRMESKTDLAGKTVSYTYDNNDNVTSITDPMGKTTTYNYDANDNVTRIINAQGIYTDMAYDNNDFLTSVSFGNYTRSYTYNRDGSVKTFTDPNGHTFNYSYNNSGELTSDGTTTLTYKNNGRIWKVTRDGKPITYEYDAFGRTSSITYDGKTVNYTYDPNGNVKTITYPGNKTVTYNYNALNRMTSVIDWNNATTYYYYRADGQLDYFQYPNQVRTTYSYDNAGRCNGFSTKRNSGNGAVIAEYSFEFDAVGNHSSETFTEPYDSYLTILTDNIIYNNDATNHLNSAGDLTFTYDNNGNTITRTGRTYNYDVINNLTTVNGDFTASYTYDGLGNRRTATRNDVTTKYVLNLLAENPTVLMETDANGNVQDYYIYGASGLVSRIDANNNTRYYVYDFRGSTVAMTDATSAANITHKYQYDDFGKVLQSEEADLNRFRYVGKFGVMYEDDVLTFMRARYYDPEIGRFLSEDPIWSTNLYPYAENNPMMGIDPDGNHWASSVISWVATGTKWCIGDLSQIVPDIINGVELEILGSMVPGVGWVSAAYAIADLGISMWERNLDKKSAQLDIQIANQTAAFRAQEEQKKKEAEAAQKAAIANQPWNRDPEAMRFILCGSDNTAKYLRDSWHAVCQQSWDYEKKLKMYEILLKKSRSYLNQKK